MTLRWCFACNTPHPTGSACPNRKPWGGRATQHTKRRLLQRDGHHCQECGTPVTFATAHIDHVEPRAMGGTDADTNLRITCVDCNLQKGNG